GMHSSDDGDDFLSRELRPVGVFRTSTEFCSCFVNAHRIRRTAFGKVSATSDDSPVPQVDLQDRHHLVEAGALGLGIAVKVYFPNHLLHVRPLNHLVGVLAQTSLSLE